MKLRTIDSIVSPECFFAWARLNTLRVYFRQVGRRREPKDESVRPDLRTFVSIERPVPVTKELRRDTFLKEV